MLAIGKDEDCLEGVVFTADSNYHSETNLKSCDEMGVDAYVPDPLFRQRDPRFETRGKYKPEKKFRFGHEDFTYDEGVDWYVCPQGNPLKRHSPGKRSGGNIYRLYVARLEECRDCPVKDRCLHSKRSKRKSLSIPVGHTGTFSQQMRENIDTPLGRLLYSLRMAVVEPVFANIRIHKRLDRFTLRGKKRVNIQWLLSCMVYNMEKIAVYGTV